MAAASDEYLSKLTGLLEGLARLGVLAVTSIGRAFAIGLAGASSPRYVRLRRGGRLLGSTAVIALIAVADAVLADYVVGIWRPSRGLGIFGSAISMSQGDVNNSFFLSVMPMLVLGGLFTWLLGTAASTFIGRPPEGTRMFAAYFFALLWVCSMCYLVLWRLPIDYWRALGHTIEFDDYARQVPQWLPVLAFCVYGTRGWAGILHNGFMRRFRLPAVPTKYLCWTVAFVLTLTLGLGILWGFHYVQLVLAKIHKPNEISTPYLNDQSTCGSDGEGGVRCYIFTELSGPGYGVFLSHPSVRWVVRPTPDMTGGSGPIDSAALHPKIEASSPRVLKAGDQIVFSLSVRRNEWCTILATEELQRYLREKRLHKYRLFMIRVSMPLWYLHPTDRFHDTDRDEKNLFLFVHAKQMVTDSLDCTKPN